MNLLHSFVWCLSLSWKASKFYTILRIIAGITTPLIVIALAFTGKHVIDLLADQGIFAQEVKTLVVLLVGLFALAVTRTLIQRADQYCQAMHEDILNGKLSLIIMERALSADLEYFDNPAYHDKLMAANSDSYGIVYIIWNAMSTMSAIISFAGAFFVLWYVNFIYGLVILVAAIPSSIMAAHYTKMLYMLNLDQINGQRQMGYIQSVATDRFYAQDLRLYNAGGRFKEKYQRIWKELFVNRRSATRRRALFIGMLECLPEAVLAWISIDIALNVLDGQATVGDYSLYIGLAGQLWSAISMLSSSIVNIYDNQMKIENFKAIENFKNRVEDHGTKQLQEVESISFEDISFAYPGTEQMALNKINFYLYKGEKVALVGLNGSGKSTLIKLLLRLCDPNDGIIRINGIDVKEYTLVSLRAAFSCYFQDMWNYSFTLRENFALADETCADLEKGAKIALNAADCNDIIEKCIKGLDTNITRIFEPDGIELSGGQHQKLALARTLYRRHSALILDEPSSNLDPKAEHDIFEALKEYSQDKMTIFTSHRLSNVFLADRIIVLENGCIIEDGTQKELLANPHRYAELYKYQQEKYIENTSE